MRGTFLVTVAVLATATTAAHALPAQNPRLVAIPSNTAIDLGRYGCESPAGEGGHCENITDYSGMVHDPHTHRLFMFGGGHAGTSGTIRSDVSAFDFTTLTWSSDYAPTSCGDMKVGNIDTTNGAWTSTKQPLARHTYDMLVMLDDPPEMLLATSGAVSGETCSGGPAPAGFALQTRIAGYAPTTRKWTYRKTDPGQWDSFSAAELDPVSGATMILGSYGLWAYDAKADAFLGSQFDPTELGYANNLVYARKADRMYYFARGAATRVFELALDRAAWTHSTLTELTSVVGPASPETGYAYDDVNDVLGGGIVDGQFTAFDPATRSWTTLAMRTDPPGGTIGTLAFHEIAFDPVDGVFLFITDAVSGYHVWAYRFAGAPPSPPANVPGGATSGPVDAGASSAASPAAPTSGCATVPTTSVGDTAALALAVTFLGWRRRLSKRERERDVRDGHV